MVYMNQSVPDFIYSNDLIDYNFAINFMQNKVERIIKNQENENLLKWNYKPPTHMLTSEKLSKSPLKICKTFPGFKF